MLSRQCRARLSYRNYIVDSSHNKRALITIPLPLRISSTRLPLFALDKSTRPRSQTRQYAQSPGYPAEEAAEEATPLLTPISHHPPSASDPNDLPSHLENLRVHLAASFLPLHQPLTTSPSSAAPQLSTMERESGNGSGSTATFSLPNDDGLGESVIGIVSPFEGGDCYNREAVMQTAASLGADVVRIDLALAIGLSDSLGTKGTLRSLMGASAHLRHISTAGQQEPLARG
jgi:hypothetical protein